MKNIIIFLLGGVTGAVAANLITSNILTRKFDAEIDDAVSKEIEEYKKSNYTPLHHIQNQNEVKLADTELIPNLEEVHSDSEFIDYSTIAKKPPLRVVHDTVDLANSNNKEQENYEENETVSSNNQELIHEISEEDFYDNKIWYDKRSLEYYPGNDMLVDEETEEICSLGEGSDLENLGDVWNDLVSSDPPFHGNVGPIFIRNDEFSIDYMITIKQGSYDV